MSDFGRFLPLSNRRGGDESHVSGNWARQVGSVILQLADAVEELRPDALESPSSQPGESIGTVLRRVVVHLETPRHRRMATMMLRMPPPQDFDRAELIARLRTVAVAALAPRARRGIRDLSEAVVAAFDLSVSTGAAVTVDPIASGAVAVARSLTAPVPIRAVLSQRTLVAVDAGWTVGRGSAIEGSASAIVLFLFGRAAPPSG